MKLKLTYREKVLFILAMICLVVTMLFYLVIKPQLDMLNSMEKQAFEYRIMINGARAKVNPHNPIFNEYMQLSEKTSKISQRYYDSLVQEQVLLMLEHQMKASGILINSISFTEPKWSDLKKKTQEKSAESDLQSALTDPSAITQKPLENQQIANATDNTASQFLVEELTAFIYFEGEYNQIYQFIDGLQKSSSSLICNEVQISSAEGDRLSVALKLNIYSIPKNDDLKKSDLYWNKTEEYGKQNPFTLNGQ